MSLKHFFLLTRTFFFSSLIVLAVACSEDDPDPLVPVAGQEGYFIVNEGAFGNANTSLSFYDREADEVTNNVFENTNGFPLGDQAQSMSVYDGRGFIVVQNSAKVEVINAQDFNSLATIDQDIASPRFFLGISPQKGYVSDWGADGVSGSIRIIDLETYSVSGTLSVGEGPNAMLGFNGRVYVANGGGLGYDSTLAVINPQNDGLLDHIVVGDNPSSLAADVNGNLWVAGSGRAVYDPDNNFALVEEESSAGFIARLENDELVLKLEVPQVATGPADLVIDESGQTVYFRYIDGIYRMNIDDESLPAAPFIPGSFYALALDPLSGEILLGEAPNFSDDGTFYRYTSGGQLIESYTVGIGPGGFAF
jgi:hypothetical protein